MLATDILTQDHAEVLSMIDELEGVINDEPGHRETFRMLEQALQVHMRAEEEIYYPALAQNEEFSDLMEDQIPEHEGVKESLAQMGELSPADEVFQNLLTEMKLAIEAHATREEDEIFPESIDVLGSDRINELGTLIDQMKGDSGMSRSAGMNR